LAQPINRSPLDFEVKPRNRRSDFEAQITKPNMPVLMPKLGETIASSFEAKLEKTIAVGFEAKPPETVTTGFEVKPVKTVRVILRPNHSQIVDLSFEAQLKKPALLVSTCQVQTTHGATRSLDRPATTRPVRPSPILCTWSSTLATVLVAARHIAPATCTLRDK
jgi:hypothetical protein